MLRVVSLFLLVDSPSCDRVLTFDNNCRELIMPAASKLVVLGKYAVETAFNAHALQE